MKNYHLHLRGFVGGYDFDARHVQNVLTANKNKPVDVLIDSLGGSVATALTIASAFRDHGDVHVHFVGMNASAATIASMGAKSISMDSSAMYLVHKCSSEFFQWASLNADQLDQQIKDLTQMKTDLEKIDLNVATMYAKRCGKERDALLDLMKIGGWLNATEAHDWGFVDTITDEAEDTAPVLTDSIASAMAAVGMPIPNMPIQSSSRFQEFLAALAEFFRGSKHAEVEAKNTNPTISDTTMKKFPFLAAVLLLADAQLTLADGKFPTDETQLGLIENALKEASEKAQALTDAQAKVQEAEQKLADAQAQLATANANLATANARIEELGKQPGDTTHQVHNNAGAEQQPQKSGVEEFFDTNNEARKLFGMLP